MVRGGNGHDLNEIQIRAGKQWENDLISIKHNFDALLERRFFFIEK